IQSPIPDSNARLITVIGALDESNIDTQAQNFYKLIEQYPKKLFLLFDLEKLDYMNSKTIGYVIDWSEKIKNGGGKMVITNVPQNIYDILSTVGITGIIPAYPTKDEALKHLFK
ncbi:STAS domain-containing protein, partial [Candidatus Peregrinibacteria bacterium]|nr:STAS domain-containing protein [Candidatus Peregrinibacteria bacterium]